MRLINAISAIPVTYDVSQAFIVVLVAVLTLYMGFRLIRRCNLWTILAFVLQLCILTVGVLTVIQKVLSIPLYEIGLILFGVLIPLIFLIYDYVDMKKRIKKANSDVPLVEKLEKQSNKGWRYEEYIDKPDEWKQEIKAGAITATLELADKHLKANLTQQITAVHQLIDTEAYDQALDVYTILSGLLSENPLINYNTAWLHQKNERFEEAIKYYKKALALVGEESGARGRKKGRSEDDTENLRPMAHYGYAMCLYALKKYEMAISQFTRVLKEIPALKEAEVNIARCYMAIGDLGEAKNHIKAALQVKEDNKLRFLLAKLCYEQKEEMECKYQLETIVAQDNEFTEAYILLGQIYRKSKDWQNAQMAYKKLTQLMPQEADYYYRLGVAQREDGKTEEALSNFRFAAELMPEHSRAFYSMASIYDAEGKTEKAIECLNKSLEGNEKLEMTYNLLAEIYVTNDRVNEAITVYERSIVEHPESYLLHYNLGVSLMMMKRYEEAVRIFKRASKLTNDDPALYYNWASALIGIKNYAEAARLYKEGLKYKSDDDEILFGLARVSALQGDVDATLSFLRQAFEINPDLRLRAKASHDFSAFRTLPEFMELTKLPMREERKHA